MSLLLAKLVFAYLTRKKKIFKMTGEDKSSYRIEIWGEKKHIGQLKIKVFSDSGYIHVSSPAKVLISQK